ncbi:MAG: carbohydrate binding family 9 domain-containing protein [Deltaproteobacteria bacterium]|nr:carbohydrate binding family 9 domain-containing protein [Deltaproteobacteria bacterium]
MRSASLGPSCWLLSLLLLSSPEVLSAEPESRCIRSVRISTPPVIDGALDDLVWQLAEPSEDFVQQFPRAGAAPSFTTQVRLLHDDEALYLAALCRDPEPERIVARVTRRDRWIDSDLFTFHVDSRHDRRSGFFFQVNAAGVKRDGTLYDENQTSEEWDAVWEAAVRIGSEGWSVEMRIPLALLRYQPGEDLRFGANFHRWVSRLQESSQWQFISPKSSLWVSRFGEITGLDFGKAPFRFELAPYAVLRHAMGGVPSAVRPMDVGADGKLGLGSDFTLTWTANPDFGQVEADQVVLNLSTIETYFPEKRPFFLADMGLLRTPLSGIGGSTAELFYTRRIGRMPRTPELEDGEELVSDSAIPRIYGALKLSGQTRDRFGLGVLQAISSASSAWIRDARGELGTRQAEPLTSATVLRIQQGLLRRSSTGLTACALATPFDGTALSAGADMQLELFDDDYQLDVLGLASYLTRERFAWQSDESVRAALEEDGPFGYGGRLRFEKVDGEHLVAAVNALYYSPNLALNDLGYLDRADRFMLFAWLRHHRTKPLGPLAVYSITLSGWLDRSSSWLDLGDGFELDAGADFIGGWWGGAWFFCGWPLCDDRETRTQGRVPLCGQAQRYKLGIWAGSPGKHVVSASLDAGWRSTERGNGFWAQGGLSFNLHPRLQIELLPGFEHCQGSLRWIDTQQAETERFLFAEQDSQFWSVTMRSTFMFTTELSLQAYAQIFLAAVDHGAKYAAAGDAIHVSDLRSAPDVGDDYDYTSAQLNLNVILRWEYLPGAVLYAVYSGAFGHGLEAADFRFGRLMDDLLLDEGAQHVLLVKASLFWR